MPRSPVTCVFPSGESFRCTRSEAEEIVANDAGDWDGQQTVRMKPHGRSGGRLSLRVGSYLAEAVRRNRSWAQTMLREIESR
jgi:hypothetical protein